MTRAILIVALLAASTSASATDNDPAPSGTLSRERCEALSDSFWLATQELLKPCATKQCVSRRTFWQRLRDDSRKEFIDGNCSYWTGQELI